jgi:lipopolysaccharide export system protein LptC
MRKRSLVAVTLLGVAAAGGLAVWQLRPQASAPAPAQTRSDYILENFELTTLDDQGQESFSVQAPRLERDPRGKSLTLTLPQFSFPDQDGGRWQATSKTAWVADKGVEVRLNTKVEMIGPPTPLGDRTRFNTDNLQIFPKRDLAQTDDSVTVSRADSILRGTGLRANMKTHQIQLLANVKGRYAPPRP